MPANLLYLRAVHITNITGRQFVQRLKQLTVFSFLCVLRCLRAQKKEIAQRTQSEQRYELNKCIFSVCLVTSVRKKNRTEYAELTEISTSKMNLVFSLCLLRYLCAQKKFLLNFPGIQTYLYYNLQRPALFLLLYSSQTGRVQQQVH